MRPIVIAGVVLAVLAGVLLFVHGFAGFYKNPSLGWVFPVGASLIELCVLIWALRQTALAGRGYGGQVLAGLLVALIAGVLVLPISFAWTSVFPDFSEVQATAMADGFADRGMSEDQIEAALQSTAFTRTPMANAFFGFLGTVVTGVVLSLIIAIFVRKKD